jgi:hypothetical protein
MVTDADLATEIAANFVRTEKYRSNFVTVS